MTNMYDAGEKTKNPAPPPESLRSATLADAPERFASMGWPVFPLGGHTVAGDPMKQPLRGSRGFKDATTDLDEVSRLWARSRGRYGIGLATGEDLGLWVLDIDMGTDKDGRVKAGDESISDLTARHGRLPDTVTAKTGGGGWHLYFRMPTDRPVRNSSSKVGKDLDVRGTGGYVVLPPSPHPSGSLYQWLPNRAPGEIEPATAPEWLLELASPLDSELPLETSTATDPEGPSGRVSVVSGRPGGRSQPVDVSREDWPAHAVNVFRKYLGEVLGAEVGSRRRTLGHASLIAGRLVATGALNETKAAEALRIAGEATGLDPEEVAAQIRSGIRTGKGGR